jgi:hypothetical protein
VLCAAVVCLIAFALVWIVSSVSSVEVTFINDSNAIVILPNCGNDLTELNPGQQVSVAVYKATTHCSVDPLDSARQTLPTKCLAIPQPMLSGEVVRISSAVINAGACS